METAAFLAPALAALRATARRGEPVQECGFCELHPGEADGLDWADFSARFGNPDWDTDPDRVIAPGGESWTGFVNRVSDALDGVAARHPGELVVVACHAGVVEASLLAKLPVVGGLDGARMKLRTQHASLTTWEVDGRRVEADRLQRRGPPPGDQGVGGGRAGHRVGAVMDAVGTGETGQQA